MKGQAMIKGLTTSDIKDIANGNAKYNRFVANLDKDELLEDLATRLVKKGNEDFVYDLSVKCDELYDLIDELDRAEPDDLAKISEKLDRIHTDLCVLRDDMEGLNQ